MRFHTRVPFAAWLLLFLCAASSQRALAQSTPASSPPGIEDDDPKVILELGASTSWTTSGGAATFAPNLAAETTPIENWLEIEAGISPFYTRHSTDWSSDFLFKKPWTLTPKAEFMLGIGPAWDHVTQSGKSSDTFSAELAGDFMFWPTGRHRFGWYLEPAYNYAFASGHPQSLGMSGGLLIGLARKHK
jgi:hypothetical protein